MPQITHHTAPAKYRALAVLTLVAGLAMLVWGGKMTWQRYVMLYRWPTVNAVSTGSRVNSHRIGNSAKKSPKPTYAADATFHYSVNGREYTANAGPGYNTNDRLWAYAWAEDHKAGTEHIIRYDPADPAQISAMEPGFHTILTSFLLLAAGVLLTGIGVAAVKRY